VGSGSSRGSGGCGLSDTPHRARPFEALKITLESVIWPGGHRRTLPDLCEPRSQDEVSPDHPSVNLSSQASSTALSSSVIPVTFPRGIVSVLTDNALINAA